MKKQNKKINKWRRMKSQDLLSLLEQLNRIYGSSMVKGMDTKRLYELAGDINLVEDILKERLSKRPDRIGFYLNIDNGVS